VPAPVDAAALDVAGGPHDGRAVPGAPPRTLTPEGFCRPRAATGQGGFSLASGLRANLRAVLVNQFYPPDLAPTGRLLHDVARALVARGHAVTVLCSRAAYAGEAESPAVGTLDGVAVCRLAGGRFSRAKASGRIISYAAFLAGVAREMLRPSFKADVVVALTTPPFVGLPISVAARVRQIAHVHWVMDVYPDALVAAGMVRSDGFVFRALRLLARWQCRGASLVLTLGPWMAARVGASAPGGTPVMHVPVWATIPLGLVPADAAAEARRARGWSPSDLVLLYSGNMGLGHSIEEFLAAAHRLGPTGPVWAFAGSGPRRESVEAFAAAHPPARIQLLSAVPQEDLAAALSAADVHLVSLRSTWQGLMAPSKLQAAFAVGRPVIFVGGRDNEAAAWIEESGGGWVVPEGDLDALLSAVESAADPAERSRRGQTALEFARARFDARISCEQIADLIEAGFARSAGGR
jgi:colanic acid biosynthesis glycosyl transferase WcaI